MRFEPRLIRPDDELPEADALELPDDLVALGEQLRADAAHLAACFPAESQWQALAARDRQRRMIRACAAAVLVMGLGLWVIRISKLSAQPSAAAKATVGQAADDALSAVQAPSTVRAADESPRPAGTPLLFRGLSGAEQEGVLDLLEEAPPGDSSVSI